MTDDDRMSPEDLDTWLEAAGLKDVRGWPNRVQEILDVDPKRWKRMRAGETIIPRYLSLAMAAHLAGLQPWPVDPARPAPAPKSEAPQGLAPGPVYQQRDGAMVEVAILSPSGRK